MNTQQNSRRQGFTIIEVVLVLAIAGLIFLMVFLALPAMQRNQRDTQRKDDVSRLVSAITSYKSNNNGKFPTASTAITPYLDTFNSPSTGSAYTITIGNTTGTSVTTKGVAVDVMIVNNRSYCENNVPKYKASSGFTVYTKIESGGGDGIDYCVAG